MITLHSTVYIKTLKSDQLLRQLVDNFHVLCVWFCLQGFLTLPGFMSYWSLLTLMDLCRSLEYLGYLGYNIIENESHVNAITGE